MTIQEFKDTLDRMSPEDFRAFCVSCRKEWPNREAAVREFVEDPGVERKLCHLLGLELEAEKQAQAAVDAARSAKWSALTAAVAALVALLSFLLFLWLSFAQSSQQP